MRGLLRGEGLVAAGLRYGLAGGINTLVGFSAVLLFDLGLRLHPNLANILGNLVGVACSYGLSRYFVFAARAPSRGGLLRYVTAVALAFGAAQAALTLAGLVLSGAAAERALAQALAAVAYSATFFLLSHYWVFRAASPAADG